MQVILLAAIGLTMILSVLTIASGNKADRPQASKDSLVQVNKYRTFMYVADQYMKTITVPPATNTTITWSTMSASSVAPPAMASTTMPLNWRVVHATDGSWVACTELDERPISAVGQLVAGSSRIEGTGTLVITPAPAALVPITIGATSYVVIGTTTTALAQATLCS